MQELEWSEDLNLGIEEIDADHRQLVGVLNELFVACLEEQGPDVLAEILARLVDHTRGHFAREEAVMERHGYPGLGAHRGEHALLIAQVLEIQRIFEKSADRALNNEMLTFLKDWLVDHIQGSDRKIKKFVDSQTAAP